jgi:hypothetical protein
MRAPERPRRSARRSPRTRLGRWWARDRTPGQRAFVLIWMALLLTLLIAVAGFAVDMANWWLASERLQAAVDSGAHAGAVFLPGDLTTARTQARRKVALNGFNDGILGGPTRASVVVTQMPNPYQLKVEATTTINNVFLSIIGMRTQVVKRDAIGQFEQPISMGSPENKMGNDPDTGYNSPQFWTNIAGPNATKVSGDRYTSKQCGSPTPARCTGTASPGVPNDDYSQNGYFYTMKVQNPDPANPLVVQVWDGEFAYVGDTCTAATFPTAAQITTLRGLAGNPYPDAATRYAGGAGTFCTGDQDISGRTMKTTFLVREPDNTPWSDTDNPVVSTATCSPQTLPAFDASSTTGIPGGSNYIFENLKSGAPGVVTPLPYGTWTFANTFRRWATICTIPPASVKTGEYLLQVRTNAKASDKTQYDASINDGGHNRMSMRVGFGTAGANTLDGSRVSMAARTRMPIYANATGANTTFYLARVTPADAGRTLRITLYDMGDAASAGTLQILAPTEANVGFTNCSFARDNGGTLSVASNCTLSNVSSANFNGRLVDVDVPIPHNYTCAENQATGCWVLVKATFPGGVSDTTTWSAWILGSPVRLVE